MAKVKVDTKGLDASGVADKGDTVGAAMNENPNFPDAAPLVTKLAASVATLRTKIKAQNLASKASTQTILDRDAAMAVVKQDLVNVGSHVDQVSSGNAVMIQSSGLGVKSPSTPIGKLAQVQNFSLTTGDKPGETDGHWNSVYGRLIYEHARCLTDPTVEANWQSFSTSGASRTKFTGQTSGTRVWWRIRANAPKAVNNGPWSQPASIIVP
jgi:hypothetical protein